MLLEILREIPDHRRAQWRQFWLWEILYLSILAILSWADSYRKISLFIKVHFEKLKEAYDLNWKKIPSYGTIRQIIQWTKWEELEKRFREYSLELSKLKEKKWYKVVWLDGKVVRWSFDNFCDKKAIQIFSALLDWDLILAHEEIEEKTNEIPVAQKFFKELWIEWVIYTLDAIHCQKKHSKS